MLGRMLVSFPRPDATTAFVQSLAVCALEATPTGGTRISIERGTSEIIAQPFIETTTAIAAVIAALSDVIFVSFTSTSSTACAVPPLRVCALEAITQTTTRISVARPASTQTDGPYLEVVGTMAATAALLAASGGGSIVGPGNVVYLSPSTAGGNDATGQRGNAARPFATWNAALAAMLDGDQLRVGPGFYAVSVAPTLNLPTSSIVSEGFAFVSAFGGVNQNILNLGLLTQGCLISDIIMDASGAAGNRCISFDGTGGAGVPGRLSVQRCELRSDAGQNALILQSVNDCDIRDTFIREGTLSIVNANCELENVRSEETGVGLVISFLTGADSPARQVMSFRNVEILGDCSVTGAPNLFFDEDCFLTTFDTPAGGLLIDAGTPPQIVFNGEAGDFTIIYPDTATAIPTILDGARLNSSLTATVTAPAANAQTIRAVGMRIGLAAAVTINDGVDVTAPNFTPPTMGQVTTPGTGTLTPATMLISGTILGAGTTVVALPWNAGAVPTSVTALARALAAEPLACSAKTAVSVSLDSTAGGTVDVAVAWA